MTYIPPALRKIVHDRALGACEYCLLPDVASMVPHQVDHIVAQKHGGATEADNLALSCALCNKHKGSDIASIDPASGALVALFHPRRDLWRDHFGLEGATITALTPTGRVTARLLAVNEPSRVRERELLAASGLLRMPG